MLNEQANFTNPLLLTSELVAIKKLKPCVSAGSSHRPMCLARLLRIRETSGFPFHDQIGYTHKQTKLCKDIKKHKSIFLIPSCHLQVLLPKGALPPLRTFQCVKMPVWFSTYALLASLLPGCHLFPLTNLTSLARETQLWWMHLWGSIHSRRSTSSRLTSFR